MMHLIHFHMFIVRFFILFSLFVRLFDCSFLVGFYLFVFFVVHHFVSFVCLTIRFFCSFLRSFILLFVPSFFLNAFFALAYYFYELMLFILVKDLILQLTIKN